jgi:type III pantothenate kinase
MNYNLLIDIGNSNVKVAVGLENKIVNVKRFENPNRDFEVIITKISKYYKCEFSKIGISSLNISNRKAFIGCIKNKFNISPDFIDINSRTPIKFKYEKTLGSDRICSSVAASIKYKNKKNILVIDFGTATTFNLITNKIYVGGIISTGIITSLKSLIQNTTLPKVNFKSIPKLINSKTHENIISGVFYQSLFFTERVITELTSKYNDLYVIATGGMSKFIIEETKFINKYEPNLVLEGLNYILRA